MTQTKYSKLIRSEPLSPPSTQLSSPASRIEICHIGPIEEVELMHECSGFLGSTSFSATIPHGDLTADAKGVISQNPLISTSDTGVRNSAHFRLGVKVLSQLPSEQACQSLLDRYLSRMNEVSFHKPTIQFSLKAFWMTFGTQLKVTAKLGILQKVATVIFRNGSVPLKGKDDAS